MIPLSWYNANIKHKLTVNFAVLVLFVLSIFSFVILTYYANLRETSYFERLHSNSVYIADNLLKTDSSEQNAFYKSSSNLLNNLKGQRVSVIDYTNKQVAEFNGGVNVSQFDLMKVRREFYVQFSVNDTQHVAFDFKNGRKRYLVLSTAYDNVGFAKYNALKQLIYLLLVVSVFVVLLIGYWFSLMAMKPIKDIINKMKNITSSNLHQRVQIKNTHDELGLMAQAFNAMLDRIENSFVLEQRFVANASHEYRTPITSMKGQIEVALMRQRSVEEYQTILQSLLDDINKLIDLHTALSELMKAQSASFYQKFICLPVIEVITDAKNDLLKSHPDYRITISVPEYPANLDDTVVKGDESLLKSAFKNLMDNACKFANDNACEVVIHFIAGEITIEVLDKGPGIPDEDLPHIFTPFYRSDKQRHKEGFGIGLSIVKRIVDVHKGEIRVKSTSSKGTTFIVTLPSAKD